MQLKIGVIVHGPGIIDSGWAKKIIDLLRNYGDVSARLGGTMGRTAIIDAKLEDIINIDKKLLPSQSIELLVKTNDILFLLNQGKSTITGHTFGYKVLSKLDCNVNLIQVERPGCSDGCLIDYTTNDYNLLDELSGQLGLPVVDKNDVSGLVSNLTGYTTNEGMVVRRVAGVSSGENIMLNGIIIGRATSDELEIIAKNDEIVDMNGGVIKQHGLEKLGSVDLKKAIIKTGLLRRSDNITPRIINKKNSKDKYKVIYLNHAADDIYQYNDADLLVSIGDDTTLLSSDILYRFNIPIIGITDGDLDRVVLEGFKHKDSIIIQLESGYDDIIGQQIHRDIFDNKEYLYVDNLNDFRDKIIELVENSKLEYKFIDKQL